MYLPEGHTAHYGAELPAEHPIHAQDQKCLEQDRKRGSVGRRILRLYRLKI